MKAPLRLRFVLCSKEAPFVCLISLGEGVTSSWKCSCACVQDLHKEHK